MSQFIVSHAGRQSDEPFAPYHYYVMLNGQKVAELSHDYRGEDYKLRLPGEPWMTLADRVLEGGGPQPLVLSPAGLRELAKILRPSP